MQIHQAQHGTELDASQPPSPTRRRLSFFSCAGKLNALVGHAMNSQLGHVAAVIMCVGFFSFFLSQGAGMAPPKGAISAVEPATSKSQTATLHVAGPTQRPATKLTSSISKTRQNSWLIASETTHVHVIDNRGLIVFSGLVKAGNPVLLNGSKPFNIEAAKEGTVSLVSGRYLRSQSQRIAVL